MGIKFDQSAGTMVKFTLDCMRQVPLDTDHDCIFFVCNLLRGAKTNL